MDMMAIRRRVLMGQKSNELYPVGTNVYSGVVFQVGSLDRESGEIIDGDYAVSDFIPVSTDYQYTRSYRLYRVANYDASYNYLGYQNGVNDLGASVISAFLSGTKYIRVVVLKSYMNQSTGLIVQNGCWLKRTA